MVEKQCFQLNKFIVPSIEIPRTLQCSVIATYFDITKHINETRTGLPRYPKTLRETWRMFRVEVKYLAGNSTSSFEIVLRVLTERSKMTVKELVQPKIKARFGLIRARS